MSASLSLFSPGTRFGQYEIVRVLGKGGMGAVYEAQHTGLKKRVALKTLLAHISERQDMVTRFMREGQAAARIRHAHVVDVSDVGICDDTPYLVMEFLEGEDLAHLLERESVLTATRISEIMLPVLSAVAAAHDAGIVHRDLKPENIYLTRGRTGDVHPKVLDFGISRLVDDEKDLRLTSTRAMLGSPFYMSPEQTRGSKNIDSKSDQYSLGVILYECATGKRPFHGESLFELMQAIVSSPLTPPSFVRPVAMNYDGVVTRAMSRMPADRYESVTDLGRELLQFASDRTRAIWQPEFAAVSRPAGKLSNPPSKDSLDLSLSLPGGLGSTTMGGAAQEVSRPSVRPPSSRKVPVWAMAAAGILGLGGIAGVTLLRSSSQQAPPPTRNAATTIVAPVPATPVPQTYHVLLSVTPTTASIEMDGLSVGNNGAFDRALSRDGATHSIRVSAPGYQPQQLSFLDAPPPDHVTLTAVPAPVILQPATPAPPVAVAPVADPHAHVHGHHGAAPAEGGAHTAAPAQNAAPAPAAAPVVTTANGAPILN